MVAEGECLQHVHDVVTVVDILFTQVIKDADLLLSLSMKPFLVANDFQRHLDVISVIFRLHHLTETASAETLQTSKVFMTLYANSGSLYTAVHSDTPTVIRAWI